MKNMKFYTRLIIGFITIDILFIVTLFISYVALHGITDVANPAAYVRRYSWLMLVLFVIYVAVVATLSVSLSRTIRINFAELSSAAKDIANGKVDVKLVKHANDEFGELVDDYQEVIKNIKEQAGIAEEVAGGNLTVTVHPKSEEDVMGNSLQKLVTRNHHALSNIHDAAYQVMTSSNQVASASEALAQGSTEQASAIEQITASINDIADKTKNNAKEADSAAELMSKALVDVKKGNQQMQEMIAAMEEINEASKSISKIIKVIDDIAFQTNILALNAAVEAARAGDAGMGFAVVAEEVRSLAAKSAAAAAETAEMIEDSILKVQSGSSIADETAKALDTISNVVGASENIMKGIAEASNYQATAIAQVDQAVEQVSQVVQSNSATSEECAAASVELSSQANRMKDLLAVYNLGSSANISMSGNGSSYATPMIDRNEHIISLKDGFGKY